MRRLLLYPICIQHVLTRITCLLYFLTATVSAILYPVDIDCNHVPVGSGKLLTLYSEVKYLNEDIGINSFTFL